MASIPLNIPAIDLLIPGYEFCSHDENNADYVDKKYIYMGPYLLKENWSTFNVVKTYANNNITYSDVHLSNKIVNKRMFPCNQNPASDKNWSAVGSGKIKKTKSIKCKNKKNKRRRTNRKR